jgi:hypothetical protein
LDSNEAQFEGFYIKKGAGYEANGNIRNSNITRDVYAGI